MNFNDNRWGFPRTNESWIDAEVCLGWRIKRPAGWAYFPMVNKDPIAYKCNIALKKSFLGNAMAPRSPYGLARLA